MISSPLIESGSATADRDGFRRALGQFGTGVTVITAAGSPVPVGVTVNSFASVSLDPPLVLWSAANKSSSLSTFQSGDGFAVNVLASQQIDLSARFARSGGNKFEDLAYEVGLYGAPLLPGCVAQFECRRFTEIAGGDHTIFLGMVERFSRMAGTPLLFTQGRYSAQVDDPELADAMAPLGDRGRSYTFLTLLRRAYISRSSAFRQEATAAGLTVNESRILYHLQALERLDRDSLARTALMDVLSVDDTLRTLAKRGLVTRESDGSFCNSGAGDNAIAALRQVSFAAENRKLSRIEDDDIRGARKVLEAFTAPDETAA